jgi:predicted nucleotide-binding protein
VTTQETTDATVAGNEQTAVEAAHAAGLDAVIRLHDDALARIAHLAETWDQPQAEVQQAEAPNAEVQQPEVQQPQVEQAAAPQAAAQRAEVSEDDVPTGEVRVLRMAELPTVVQRAA